MRSQLDILAVLEDREIIVVMAGMKMVWNLGPYYTAAFNRIYPEIAETSDVLFMPFFLEGVAVDAELNNSDGLHPNGDGYTVVVENIYPYVLQAIKRLEKERSSR